MSVLLFGHPLLRIGLLTVFTIRLVMLKDPQILVLTMIIGVVFGIIVAANAHNGDTPYERKDCHETVKVYPDMISANGGNCHFIAKSGLSGRKVIYFAHFKSLAQKKLIMGSNRPLAMTLSGEMKAMMPATNVNQFDMRAYYHHQKIYEAFSGKEIIASRPYSQLTLTDRIHEIRSRFNHYCQALPKTLRTYALGLISGTRQSDFFDQMSGVKQLGLLHIFSISGMHVYYFLSILDRALTMLGFSGRLKGTVKLVCLGDFFWRLTGLATSGFDGWSRYQQPNGWDTTIATGHAEFDAHHEPLHFTGGALFDGCSTQLWVGSGAHCDQ